MAIISILDIQLKQESLDRAPAVLQATLTDTRAFPGCLSVTLLSDIADPAHFVLYESWESVDADRAYRAWRATPEGASELGALFAAAPKLTLLTVAEDL